MAATPRAYGASVTGVVSGSGPAVSSSGTAPSQTMSEAWVSGQQATRAAAPMKTTAPALASLGAAAAAAAFFS
jgi:hypothetical protein